MPEPDSHSPINVLLRATASMGGMGSSGAHGAYGRLWAWRSMAGRGGALGDWIRQAEGCDLRSIRMGFSRWEVLTWPRDPAGDLAGSRDGRRGRDGSAVAPGPHVAGEC
ncbi:DUF6183 family protein [Streptomyces sp. NPDC005388]|uniref:DUF6183 family protein n=1 Tax=Streptomyces sp. NPDC005388 TaxID=3156717 RepID=UPI0033B443DC